MGKSSFDTLYAYDKDLAENGAEMYVGTNKNNDDIIFIVAKYGNSKNSKEHMRLSKRKQAIRWNKKAQDKIIAEIIAKTILLGWKNVLDENGEPLPDTYENRLQALLDYEELLGDINLFSQDNINFVKDDENPEAKEETEKN